jgi:thiamine pyrophosphate-dependent acetolactate synthase large subunit-like protein
MKVYEAVAETLSRLGVDTTFGLVGSGNFGLIHHMTRHCGIGVPCCSPRGGCRCYGGRLRPR